MIKKISIIIGSIFSILLIGVYFSYDYWLEKELKYQLSEIISKDPNSLYRYSFEKLNIDLIDGSVDLKGIKIEPRDRAYDSLISDNNNLRFLLKLNLKEIELIGFEITEFIKTNNIVVEAIYLDKPEFAFYFNPNKKKAEQNMPLSEVFSDEFTSAQLNELIINDGKLEIDNYYSPEPALSINFLDIELTQAYVDKETLKGISPIEYEKVKLAAGSINANISENFSIESDSLLFDAINESFTIRNFQIKPKYDQENFTRVNDKQAQWFAITLESLKLRRIEIERFIETGELYIGKIGVSQPNIALYKDKRKPEPPFKKKMLPASAISSIPMKINVDSIEVNKGYIAINETSNLTGLKSHISFYNLHALVRNFSNIQDTESSSILTLQASTLLYNKAPVELNMAFDLASQTDEFEVSGAVDSIEMVAFNPVLEPMMAIKVTDGQLENLKFAFTAMDTLSNGTLDMQYSNAKLEVLSEDTSTTKKKELLSFAANTIIKSNNHMNKPGYIQGIISSDRVLNKDVWPFLWHSIQSGIISTMAPITNDKETKHLQKLRRQELKNERKESKD